MKEKNHFQVKVEARSLQGTPCPSDDCEGKLQIIDEPDSDIISCVGNIIGNDNTKSCGFKKKLLKGETITLGYEL